MNKAFQVSILILIISGCTAKYTMTSEVQSFYQDINHFNVDKKTVLMKDTPYATPAFVFDSGKSGTSIIILGGTHGDEPAGYEAALRLVLKLKDKPPKSGKVIVIPLANRVAVSNFNRRIPVPAGADREQGNLNRCYPGKKNGLPMEQMALQIEQLTRKHNVDVFIDMHEARYLHLNTPPESEKETGLGQTLIYYPNEPTSELLIDLMDGINSTIVDSDKKFSSMERPILNSAAWWAGENLDIAAFTFETTRAMPIETRIGYHLELVQIALQANGIW